MLQRLTEIKSRLRRCWRNSYFRLKRNIPSSPIFRAANGGRLYLLRILMAQPNVLLLDEPTNDLDIPTLIALEEYLDDFPGALIVVSHDRYFLDRTIDSVFKFDGNGKVREFAGDYTAYLETVEREAEAKTEKTEARTSARVENSQTEKPKSQKLSFKEKRELDALEAEIPETEKRLAEIENELAQFATDAYKLNELVTEQQKLNHHLEQSIERWAELAEKASL